MEKTTDDNSYFEKLEDKYATKQIAKDSFEIKNSGELWQDSTYLNSLMICDTDSREIIHGGGDIVQFVDKHGNHLMMVEATKDGRLIFYSSDFVIQKDYHNTMIIRLENKQLIPK